LNQLTIRFEDRLSFKSANRLHTILGSIKIIQSIGRSLRKHSSKKLATIFDIWDNLRYGNKHMVERLALYDREQIPYSVTELTES